MILITESKYPTCIDLSGACIIEISKKILKIIYPNSEFYVVELKTELSDEQREQLAYYLSVMKNKDEVVDLRKLMKTLKERERYDNCYD